MNNPNRKPLIALLALSAALAMPMAFAQDDTEAQATQAQAEQATPTDPATATQSAQGASVQQAEQASTSASSQGKQGWNDVDSDKDGAISKKEAASNAGLSQVFDQADADTNGKLTAEEYKAFVSKNYGEPKAPKTK
ncbi:EF-hand domain-containing protein [Pseudoxanthomonas gei]|uniref:EF-hand domain-containing protein n=1 Tax=Pseudoxanthomonas gei TaxID=1383030 RepID=A0ABX0AAC1_9GAMM|nr:EF-hand domain-containing protein [Pseudoxanthomonas gei]NDK38495.1 EF-hand domain-containing protein [Pseudoxanthomonas gei]